MEIIRKSIPRTGRAANYIYSAAETQQAKASNAQVAQLSAVTAVADEAQKNVAQIGDSTVVEYAVQERKTIEFTPDSMELTESGEVDLLTRISISSESPTTVYYRFFVENEESIEDFDVSDIRINIVYLAGDLGIHLTPEYVGGDTWKFVAPSGEHNVGISYYIPDVVLKADRKSNPAFHLQGTEGNDGTATLVEYGYQGVKINTDSIEVLRYDMGIRITAEGVFRLNDFKNWVKIL